MGASVKRLRRSRPRHHARLPQEARTLPRHAALVPGPRWGCAATEHGNLAAACVGAKPSSPRLRRVLARAAVAHVREGAPVILL